MRTIRIPKQITARLLTEKPLGRALVVPLHLGWPELSLTEGEILANAVAVAYGKERPYLDRNLVNLELEYP